MRAPRWLDPATWTEPQRLTAAAIALAVIAVSHARILERLEQLERAELARTAREL